MTPLSDFIPIAEAVARVVGRVHDGNGSGPAHAIPARRRYRANVNTPSTSA